MWLGCRSSIYDRERSQLQLLRVVLLLWHSRKGLEILKRSWHGDGFFLKTKEWPGAGRDMDLSVYNVIVVTQLQAFIKTHWRSWILFSINCISGKHVVLVSISVTLINTTTKSNFGRKGFISAHNSQTMILYWRKSEQEGRNLEAGSETEPMKKCCFLACSPWFSLVSYPIQNDLSGGWGDSTSYSELGLFTSNHRSRKCPTILPMGQFYGGIFFLTEAPSQMTLAYSKLIKRKLVSTHILGTETLTHWHA